MNIIYLKILNPGNSKCIDSIFPNNMINGLIKNELYEIKDLTEISHLRYSFQYPPNQP